MENKEAKLNYIDKLTNTLFTVGKILHSNIKWNFVIALFLLFLSSGVIKPTNKITLNGLEFEFSMTLFLIILSCTLSWFLLQIVGLAYREKEIRDDILRLYKELPFTDESMEDKECNTLEYPSFLTVTFREEIFGSGKVGTFLYIFFGIFLFTIVLGFPIIIQIVVFIKLLNEINEWWFYLIYIILFLFDFIYMYRFIKLK